MTQAEFNQMLQTAIAGSAAGGYYMSKWSGEEIDRMLDGFAPASNQNLLDNWYFKDPINQRGATEYTGAVYGIDRWMLHKSTNSLLLTAAGIVLNGKDTDNTTVNLKQALSDNAKLVSGQVTMSAIVKSEADVGLYMFREKVASGYMIGGETFSVQGKGFQLIKTTINIPEGLGDIPIWFTLRKEPGSVDSTWLAAKVEPGPHQTLAQENAAENLVLMDPPPNRTLELMKCMRYQQVIDTLNFGVMFGSAYNGVAQMVYYFPVPMRITPSFSSTGSFKLNLNLETAVSSQINVTSMTMIGASAQSGVIRAFGPGLVSGNIYGLDTNAANPGKIILDANL